MIIKLILRLRRLMLPDINSAIDNINVNFREITRKLDDLERRVAALE